MKNFTKYESRFKAGKILAEFLRRKNKILYNTIFENPKIFFSYAIPNGGIPVAEGFCSTLNINYDIIIVRKIKIPYNTEAGFGSLTSNGTIFINKLLLNRLNLTNKAIQDSIELTKEEIRNRIKFYKKELNIEDFYKSNIQNKMIFILDDGLASGYTMLAAINMIRKYKPKKIITVVPTAPLRTIKRINKEVDDIFCPNIREVMWFAVADAYKNWYDIPEKEVLESLDSSKYYILNRKE